MIEQQLERLNTNLEAVLRALPTADAINSMQPPTENLSSEVVIAYDALLSLALSTQFALGKAAVTNAMKSVSPSANELSDLNGEQRTRLYIMLTALTGND